MLNVKDIIKVYQDEMNKSPSAEAAGYEMHLKASASVVMCAASALLTALNIINRYWFMTATTALLTVGFAFCTLLFRVWKKRKPAAVIMAILCGLIFSVYALTGENEGFAILWILLVPPIGMTVLGLKVGTAVGVYFQLFLMALFYTPLRTNVSDYYTATFQIRFPILYFCSLSISTLMAVQKGYYQHRTEEMAYLDSLTNLKNRRYYDAMKRKILNTNTLKQIGIIEIDINRLKYINDAMGHIAGDELIIGSAECIRKAFEGTDVICRTGGDEFCCITYESPDVVRKQIKQLEEYAKEWSGKYVAEISLSVGYAAASEKPEYTLPELEKAAEVEMYSAKAAFYVNSGLDRRK